VLIGAGDVGFLRNVTLAAALAGFLPAVWLAYVFDLGLGGVWAGLGMLTIVRLVLLLWRWRSARWAVLGATLLSPPRPATSARHLGPPPWAGISAWHLGSGPWLRPGPHP
jgi:hypothetical protein